MRVKRHHEFALATLASALLLAAAAWAQTRPPPGAALERSPGARLYARYCADCHGRDARGTVIGFPLVARPSGPVTQEIVLESLRTPVQMMPGFPRDVISDDDAALITYYLAALDHQISGAPMPSPPDVSGLRPIPPLLPPPAVPPADPASYEMKEYDTGSCGAGHDIAVAPDGRVWFAGSERNTIVMFDPRGEAIRCWPVPTRNARPLGLRVDRDGMVWVTLTGLPDNKLAMFDPRTELFSEFILPHRPQPLIFPQRLTFDAERDPVFSLGYGDGAGRIDRKTGHFDYFPVPTYRARPDGVEVARNGHIWMSESIANKLVEIDPKTGKATEFAHPFATDDPGLGAIALDSRGNVWFAEHEFGSLGMFEPRTKRWRSWRAPANGGSPHGVSAIAIDHRDTVWFTHAGGNYVGRFDPRTEGFSIYPFPTADTDCRDIDFGRDGALWCVSMQSPKLIRLTVKGG
jgi:virginiamycin B lyase